MRGKTDTFLKSERLKYIAYRLGAFAVIVAVFTPFLNSIATRYVPGDSDGATPILEAMSVLHGNYLLHGWSISLDSFWTLDVLFNALMIKIVGFGPSLLTLTPSLIAAAVIGVAVLLAYETGHKLLGLVGPLTVIICLGLPSPDLSYYFLQGPWHVATTLYCLIAFVVLAKWRTWWGVVLATLILAVGLLGDLLLLDFGVTAIVFAGITAMLRERKLAAGIKTLAAGLLSIPLAIGLRLFVDLFGTFEIVNRNLPINLSQLTANIGYLTNRIPAMFGVGSISSAPANSDFPLELGHALMLFLVVAAVLYATGNTIFHIFKGNKGESDIKEWHLNDMLLLGIYADMVTFVIGATSNNTQYSKYLDPGVIFAVVLTARLVTSFVIQIFSSRDSTSKASIGQDDKASVLRPAVPQFFDTPVPNVNNNFAFNTQNEPMGNAAFSGNIAVGSHSIARSVRDESGKEPLQNPREIAMDGFRMAPAGSHLYGSSSQREPAPGAAYPPAIRPSGPQLQFFSGDSKYKPSYLLSLPIALILIVSLVVGAIGVENERNLPVASQPIKGLVTFLEAHHLNFGVGAYWVSSIVTLESKGKVVIRPVTNAAADKLRRYGRQSSLSWYQGKQFQFFIYNLYQPWRKVNTVSAEKTYGIPEKTLTDGPYEILIWSKPIPVSLVLPPIKNPLDLIFRN